MNLLIDFLCRFGWGLSVGLLLTSPHVVPAGFFRVNLLVVLGLATFAALLARTAASAALVPAAVAAVLAWAGSIAWFGEKRGAGIVLCVGCAAALAAATAAVTAPVAPMPHGDAAQVAPSAASHTGAVVTHATALLSGLVTGLTVHAMLLGHWYLNAPGMRIDALQRAIDVALLAWGATLTTAVVPLVVGGVVMPADPTAGALVALRWLTGLAALPVLLVMSRRTLMIPNTQSATGILYVACLAAILGELTAQLLAAGVGTTG